MPRDGDARPLLGYLLSTPGIDYNARDEQQQTALAQAFMICHGAVVKPLLETPGVDPTYQPDQTTLCKAFKVGDTVLVDLLLKMPGFDCNMRDERGKTPLELAVEENDKHIAKLINASAISTNPWCEKGATLICAIRHNDEAKVRLVLSIPSINPNQGIICGETPLGTAAWMGNAAIVWLLLATPRTDPNLRNSSPLMWAIQQGHESIVRLLLAAPDVNPDLRNNEGDTALGVASLAGNEAVVRLLLAEKEVSPDIRDYRGRMPLWKAARIGNEGVVRILLATRRVEPNVITMVGCQQRLPSRRDT